MWQCCLPEASSIAYAIVCDVLMQQGYLLGISEGEPGEGLDLLLSCCQLRSGTTVMMLKMPQWEAVHTEQHLRPYKLFRSHTEMVSRQDRSNACANNARSVSFRAWKWIGFFGGRAAQ